MRLERGRGSGRARSRRIACPGGWIPSGGTDMNRELLRRPNALSALVALASILVSAAGCTPTVAVEAPKEPITINLNVKIEHEIRVKVDDELDELFDKDDEIF